MRQRNKNYIDDPIGFNPTLNQSEFGTPRHSPYGIELRATPPVASVDYFPTWPYRGDMDYLGAQGYVTPITESIFARTTLYGGIAPLELQPLIRRPYPYEVE